LHEARAAAALNHPHICTIHEVADVDNRIFIVMEHVDGPALNDLPPGGLPIETAIRYGIQLADALAHAHERGIVHRDLKTANLMLTADSRVKVLDFGIARRVANPAIDTATGMPTTALDVISGTLAYMAPELLRGAVADCRSDIWAMGVVLYELIAGRRPFAGVTTFELSSAILRDVPSPLPGSLPAALRSVVSRCLSKDPSERYQRAGEIRAALELTMAAGTAGGQVSTSVATAQVAHALPATSASLATEKSIVVLPFANLSADADDAYFSDGLTDELITDLSRVAGLRVAPSAASFRLKNANKDLATIAGEFNVRYIVEGRVRKAGRSIRITAQLVDVAEDRTIWADKYTGELEHVFELQERVSRSIAEALQLRLQPASRVPKPEAVEAFLKGRHFARQATSAGFQKALQCFQLATELDPNYAPAFASLGDVYVNLTTGWDALPALETMPKAQAAALRAMELDPTLPHAHVVRAMVAMFYEWDLPTAEREFKEALRINPNHADAHRWYAQLLMWLDTRYAEALDHVQRAASLDPVDLQIQVYTALVYGFSRDFSRAVERAQHLVAAEPLFGFGHFVLGFLLTWAGRSDEAISCFRRAIDLDGRESHHVALLGTAYAITGDRTQALACLAELDALDRAGRNVAPWKLHVYVGLGDADQVIRCLEVAVDQRTSSTVFMVTHPYLDFVRRDPRFIALLQKMGLGYLTTRTWQPEWRSPMA
jgi:TolB-like protein/cytochrome c-type biogenesis protein CcmH/NrfG